MQTNYRRVGMHLTGVTRQTITRLVLACSNCVSQRYLDHHPTPTEIFLLVEVADITLMREHQQKARANAKAKIADSWVLDVNMPLINCFPSVEIKSHWRECP